MEEQKKSYLTSAGAQSKRQKLAYRQAHQINVPWSVNTRVNDNYGNPKQISAVGNATLNIDDSLKNFYEEYAETVLSDLFTDFVSRFGWQFLKPGGEELLKRMLCGNMQGINIEKVGLISLREWDLDPAYEGSSNAKIGVGKTLYQNFSWNNQSENLGRTEQGE